MKIKDLLVRRRQIIAMSTMEKNRFQVMPKFLKTDIKRLIQFLELKRKKIEQGLNTLIEKEDEWREKRQILLSMTGVGRAVAHTLSGDLPELGPPDTNKLPPCAASRPTIGIAENSAGNAAFEEHDPASGRCSGWPSCLPFSITPLSGPFTSAWPQGENTKKSP